MQRADFNYELPDALIAREPAPRRADSRLLHLDGASGAIVDRAFRDLPTLLRAGDLLVFNDTRVIKARFFGRKDSGGQVEVMLERIVDATHAICQIRASKAPKAGSTLRLADAFDVRMTGRAGTDGDFFALELVAGGDFWALAEQYGKLPLPPYIEHPAEGADETRGRRGRTVGDRRRHDARPARGAVAPLESRRARAPTAAARPAP